MCLSSSLSLPVGFSIQEEAMDVGRSTSVQTLDVGPGFESLQSNVVVNVLLMMGLRIWFEPWTLMLLSSSRRAPGYFT